MKCASCGQENAEGQKYCRYCGKLLDGGAAVSGNTGAETIGAVVSGNTGAEMSGAAASGDVRAEAYAAPEAASTGETVVSARKSYLLPALLGVGIGAALIAVMALLYFTIFSQSAQARREIREQNQLAEQYLDDLDYERAVAAYQAVLELDPANTEALRGFEDTYVAWAEAEPAQAERLCREAAAYLEGIYADTEERSVSHAAERLRELERSAEAAQSGSDAARQSAESTAEAAAAETDGSDAAASTSAEEATVDLSALEQTEMHITQVDTSAYPDVSLYFYVRDLQGNYIGDLPTDAFHFFEYLDNSWSEQTGSVESMEEIRERSVSLVMDVSGSMSGDLDMEVYAANVLLEHMEQDSGYMAALTVFSDNYQEMCPFTADLGYLRDLLSGLRAGGGTALYDTLENALYKAVNQSGQKYILAFTDGENNVGNTTKDQVIELSKAYRIPIYIIYLSSGGSSTFIREMADITQASGGTTIAISDISELEGMYDRIFTMQQNLYSYNYTTSASGESEIRIDLVSDLYRGETQAEYIADEIRTEKIDNTLIAGIVASSVRAPMQDSDGRMLYYPAENMIDGDYSTAWVEGVPGRGEGEWIEITLNGEHYVNGIEIANGYWKRYDLYLRNSRPGRLRFTFSDGTTQETDMPDIFTGVSRIDFGEGVKTSRIRIEILATYAEQEYDGRIAWDDTCITELALY